MDALLGNFDRHGMNWGFLKSEELYLLAPIYDNGSCLFPRLQDEVLKGVLNHEEELKKRTYQFPTSQIKLGSQKSSYYDVIRSSEFTPCTEEAKWLISMYDRNKVSKIVNDTPALSDIRKEFYEKMIDYRFQHIFAEVFGA